MKLTGARLDAFARQPDPRIVCVLLFGPDRGLVRERAEAIAGRVGGAAAMAVSDLAAGEIVKDPARLADESASLSLFGGRRVVRVREATDSLSPILDDFLQAPPPAAFVIVEAGELGSRSSLRRLCEQATNAAAVGCYGDDEGDLKGLAERAFAAAGLSIDGEALAVLVASLGNDRGVSRREIEKLVLYKGGAGTIGVDDVVACVGDSGAASTEAVAFACLSGNPRDLAVALDRAFAEGTTAVALLRAVSRHLNRLHQAAAMMAEGKDVATVMKSLRPPVIFKHERAFRRQLETWRRRDFAPSWRALIDAELLCKTTGMPAETICRQILLELARSPKPAS